MAHNCMCKVVRPGPGINTGTPICEKPRRSGYRSARLVRGFFFSRNFRAMNAYSNFIFASLKEPSISDDSGASFAPGAPLKGAGIFLS